MTDEVSLHELRCCHWISCVSELPAFILLWILASDLSDREAREPVTVVNGVGPGVGGVSMAFSSNLGSATLSIKPQFSSSAKCVV